MTGMVMLSNLVAWSAQVALLVLAAFVALALLRVELPALRHTFLRVVLAVCLILPFAQPVQPASAPPTRGTAMIDLAFAPAGGAAAPRPPSPVEIFDRYAPPVIFSVIAAGVLARFCWMAFGVWRLRRLRRAGTVVTRPEYDGLARAIGARATLRSVAGLGQPATFGFRDPVVLLPSSLAREPRDIQLAVVAHELWHVRRHDWCWTVVEEALRAAFWWHPAIWILLSRIQGTREEVVDRLAIEATGSRRTYVDALLTYAGESPLCGSTAFGRRRHLVHRLVLISKEAVMSARRVVICGAILAVMIGGSGWAAVQAFPMQASPHLIDQDPFRAPAGPLEQRARPVTPENPIPRRTWHVPADYPAELAAVGVSRMAVTLRVTLDASGRVAEGRVVGVSWSFAGSSARTGQFGASGAGALETTVQRAPEEIRDATREATLAGLHAALSAVRQWRYDPPAESPISFSVVVPLGTESPPMLGATEVAPGAPRATPPVTRDRPGVEAPQELRPDGALRIGGNIKAPTKIRHVNPVYPQEAKDAGISGVVIIECRIEPDGTVGEVQVLRSIPMLDEAAVQAVQQWEFAPTLLNGVPMPVIMTVTVNFTLQQ